MVILRILKDKDIFALHLLNALSSRLTEEEVEDGPVFMTLAWENCLNTLLRELQEKDVKCETH